MSPRADVVILGLGVLGAAILLASASYRSWAVGSPGTRVTIRWALGPPVGGLLIGVALALRTSSNAWRLLALVVVAGLCADIVKRRSPRANSDDRGSDEGRD